MRARRANVGEVGNCRGVEWQLQVETVMCGHGGELASTGETGPMLGEMGNAGGMGARALV